MPTHARIICRINDQDQQRLTLVAEALRLNAASAAEQFPSRSRALREAIRIAAEHLSAAR
ncbi:hypothetical protein [Lichenicoccus sp.]|uniref:hypothetical protein n=1 Tax=Lichenicoccus sp. TaxID=2781899 RepID=UPI003D0FB75C